MQEFPDFTSTKMQREISKLGAFLRKRNIGPMQKAALGSYMCGGMIGKNLREGVIDEDTAEAMLQEAFEQMRAIVYAEGDPRH
ncbi:hypothetical protein [Salinisphaera sp.]|uniref:hypothetical protein n=1 Tax=Salinisphaera sp. TaxID=1914330 RepID=UPI000C4F83F5|nr:hypothetical protein [Salinisphaera sp.]MAS10312.1 hypothetical protein [Salinisphaera sp.]|tara:strand:+ start:109 stop:357 length:249 start_codon:yes stop_codon:yes gene_type:complete